MIKRIICAIWGHPGWDGMGWLGSNGFNEMVHKYSCSRCGIVVYSMEPNWHLRARYNRRIHWLDSEMRHPDKHKLGSPSYEDQLNKINANYPIDILADIHETTIEELEKLGYKN